MKKLKLSKSKVSDEKQQKISNFFAVSKEVPVISSNNQKKISSYFSVPKQESQNREINGDLIVIEDKIIPEHIHCNLDSEKNEKINTSEVECEVSKRTLDNFTSNYKRNKEINFIYDETNKITKDTMNLPLDYVRDDYSRTSQQILKNSNQSNRSPGETLCINCLKISPGSKPNSCNNCNLSEKISKSIKFEKEIVFPGEGHSAIISNSSVLIDGVDKSPDVIPATPPLVKKGNRSRNIVEKPAKRKFNFSESSELKKKCLSQVESKIKDCTEFHCEERNSKCQIPSLEEKENVQVSKIKNPFGKPNSSLEQSPCSFFSKDAKENKGKNNSSIKQKTPESSEIKIDIKCELEENGKRLDENCEKNLNVVDGVAQSRNETLKKDERLSFNNVEHEGDIHSISLTKNNELIGSKRDTFFEESSSVINNSVSTKKDIFEVTQNQPQFYEPEDISTSFLEDLSFDESTFKEPIKLDNGKRCKVIAVEHLETCGEAVLTLQPCDSLSGETAVCVLRGSWTSTVVREGDVVSVTATQMSNQPDFWVVDNNAGLLTTHPDTLVSGTTIVGSLFCTRRSVLSDMYRGMDTDSSIMVMGSFLHQLLQEVLKRKVFSLEEINGVLKEFILSRHFIFSLYSSGMPLQKTKESLSEFVPKIHTFVQKYINNSSTVSQPTNWNSSESWSGSITDVADIEENIWTPKLGIKGKVDVTVKTHKRNIKKVMPLELKTGKASFSAEHRGQVILYTMMMSELGQTVDSGLLLYLREGVMKEVKVGVAERRDLMLLRNQLVSELRASHRVVVAENHQVAPPSLPHPINHHSACAKCPYLTLCSSALRVVGYDELSETNPLHGLSVTSTDHLQLEHMLYVFHWTGLLRLEHTDNQLRSPALHDIWTLPPAERKKRGTCVPEVRLVGVVTEVTVGSYEHVFEWGCEGTCPLVEGEYVIVSSQSRPAVAAGPVRHVTDCQLTLHLERDLSVRQKEDKIWHLDRYESQTGLVFNMTNLGSLLDNTEQAGRLRKAVIDLDVPAFSPKLSSRVLKASVDVMALLNDQQKKAIFRTLAAEHYILIKGMPGTGKTATVVALVQLAVRLGLSVLITSHTHSAVDNVLLKLRGLVDFLRLGAVHKLHPELTEYGESTQVFSSPEEIQSYYDSKSVVAVTCLGSSHPLLTRKQFDLCIVDESTQVLQPTVLRPLFSARKFVLIGDPEQLPPLVRSIKAKELGLGQSLFARLDRPAVTSELSLQYRMNQRITDLANTLTYNGKLQCGSPEVASATLSLPKPLVDQPHWVCQALMGSLDQAVIILDTGETEAVDCTNVAEAEVVHKIVTALGQSGLAGERVGVIAPYRAQVELLRKHTACLTSSSRIEVNTVDQYQGRDKDIILYSCTRSKKPTESDILGDKNRLTVAITRARHKLIIIGNLNLFRDYKLFASLIRSISEDCIIPVS